MTGVLFRAAACIFGAEDRDGEGDAGDANFEESGWLVWGVRQLKGADICLKRGPKIWHPLTTRWMCPEFQKSS